jgi:hypothetical protein
LEKLSWQEMSKEEMDGVGKCHGEKCHDGNVARGEYWIIAQHHEQDWVEMFRVEFTMD